VIPDNWKTTLIVWASNHPEIRELWLFGSRARGDHRDDSDIDIAVILTGTQEKRLATWITCGSAWEAELDRMLSANVDLDLGDSDLSQTVVAPALEREGCRLYQAAQRK
jgi:predicted nucleotidyltransferase